MKAAGRRFIRPELLDDLPLQQKQGSLRDLDRLNRQSGLRPLRQLMGKVARHSDSFTMLDVGAASGFMGKCICQSYPGAQVTSLDQKPDHLLPAPAPKVAADALSLPFGPASFDFVFSSLFLHHFEDDAVTGLLREMARVAKSAVLALDLYRHPIPYYFVPLSKPVYGWDPITAHDAPVSVAAGFRPQELAALARHAGLKDCEGRSHGWSFRVTLVGWVRGRRTRH